MGVVTKRSPHFFSGVEADRAAVPSGGLLAGDIYFSTDTPVAYRWDGAAWQGPVPADWITATMLQTDSVETIKIVDLNVTKAKAELGFGRYVVRPVTAYDRTKANFTADGAWHDNELVLDGIVPAGAIAIHMVVRLLDDAANSVFRVRQNDTTHAFNKAAKNTQVANVQMDYEFIVGCDSNRLLDYFASNVVFTNIDLVVVGWFI